mgnify:CR=1 FL=1
MSRPSKKPGVAAHTRTSLLRTLSSGGDWVLPESKSMLRRQFSYKCNIFGYMWKSMIKFSIHLIFTQCPLVFTNPRKLRVKKILLRLWLIDFIVPIKKLWCVTWPPLGSTCPLLALRWRLQFFIKAQRSKPTTPRQPSLPTVGKPSEPLLKSNQKKKKKPKFLASKNWLLKHGLRAKELLLIDALSSAIQRDRETVKLDTAIVSRLLDEFRCDVWLFVCFIIYYFECEIARRPSTLEFITLTVVFIQLSKRGQHFGISLNRNNLST